MADNWKRSKSDINAELYRQAKGRQRIRSTFFEDEIHKQDRRGNRRQNEKQLIDEELQLEEDMELSLDAECEEAICGGCYKCTPVWDSGEPWEICDEHCEGCVYCWPL